ncbi:hypothetical protein DRO53_04030 [Candidatus Bathyarchaeota archaeon]|nr:MAG: hypothetical protein DRO53_04030 [Candidatus Bathyarchaeota archaeon]
MKGLERKNGRTPSGIRDLDDLLEGGFHRGSLILLAGNPGTGKTTFAAKFLCEGVSRFGEPGLYVSFAEDEKTFRRNVIRHLGKNCGECSRRGRECRFLDMVTAKEEGLPSILEMVLAETAEVGAQRLVIDSFSAMAQAFNKLSDARIILHTVLSRVVRRTGCVALMVAEVPYGSRKIGLGVEEFVADGVILLKSGQIDGRLFRDLEIKKMRGTRLQEREMVFTLEKGFKVFKPFKIKKPEKPRRFQAIPDPPNKFSTGAPDLDAVLNGGYPKGATVLLEVDRQIETLQYHLLITPTAWNFVVKGRVIVVIPSVGIDYNVVIRRGLDAGLTMEEINKYLRVTLFETLKGPTEPYIIKVKGDNMSEDLTKVFREVESLGKKLGKPALAVIGADTLLSRYGEDNALKAISTGSTVTRERGALNIILLKPGYTRVAEILRAASDVHLRVTREHGVILFYGVKPRTGLYVMEMDVSQGYPLPKLTPIV